VYALFDPRDSSKRARLPFYVGKGRGNRVFAHARRRLSQKAKTVVDPKLGLIADIIRAGREVEHVIVRCRLSASEAFDVEASLIDLVNWCEPGRLTNKVKGRGTEKGIIAAKDCARDWQAKLLRVDAGLLLLKIDKRWKQLLERHRMADAVPDKQIYQAVRSSWKIRVGKGGQARVVLAVARGIVRGAYAVKSWAKAPKPGRWEFKGSPLGVKARAKYVGKSVATHFRKGSQNPVRYLEPSQPQTLIGGIA
jgi:hypothetical protein